MPTHPAPRTGSSAATKTTRTPPCRWNLRFLNCSGRSDLKITPVALPSEAAFPDGRPFIGPDLIAQAKGAIEKAEADLKKANDKPEAGPVILAAALHLQAAKAALPALEARMAAEAAVMATPVPPNVEELSEQARKLERSANFLLAAAETTLGQYELEQAKTNDKKRDSATRRLEAAVKSLKEPAESYTPIGPRYPNTSSGRRTALAGWITAKDNPLTARVAINHMWLRHFGKPLVPTVFNFGKSGKAANTPGTARLAGGGVYGPQLGHEGHASADGHLRRLQDPIIWLDR